MGIKQIQCFFERDHTRLKGLFSRFLKLVETNPQLAKLYYQEFRDGLERHILWEDNVLLPVFARKFDGEHALIEEFKSEHRSIERGLKGIQKVLDRSADEELNKESLLEEREQLESAMVDHNEKEETLFYPRLQEQVSDEEQILIYGEMKRIHKTHVS